MKKIIKLFVASYICFQSCDKKEIVPISMDIRTEKLTYAVGEDVVFDITGNPDQLTFYSGEEKHKYAYINRTKAESKEVNLEFTTNRRYGSDAQQPNSLRLFASQSFSGVYNTESIVADQWVDITSKFTLSPIASNDGYTSTGKVNLLDLQSLGFTIDPNKLLYFGFRYMGNTGSTQPRWWIGEFALNTVTPDDQVLPITTLQSGGWTSVIFNNSPVNWVFNTSGLRFQGGGAAVGSNHVWSISKGLNLNAVDPDKGVALKNMSTRIDSFTYKYEKPGTYHVVFVGANTTVYGDSRSIKEFTIIIE